MTGLKAQWHLAEALEAHEDPFMDVVRTIGVEIDLATASEEEVVGALSMLVERESRLFDHGVTCNIKDDGQDCRTCLSACMRSEDAKHALCRIGKDQMLVMARASTLSALRNEPLMEFVSMVEEATEIGHLSPEWGELLVTSGR